MHYEVAFVVEGYVSDEDAYLGETLECNGFYKENGTLYLKDGRAYYDVEAMSAQEAYEKGRSYFEADDFGELEILDTSLEHVSLGDTYWYPEDLKNVL